MPRYEMEIIEFPMVLVDARTFPAQVMSDKEFQVYVRPILNPRLTKFCTELTGIEQDQVDNGVTFPQAFNQVKTCLLDWAIFGHSICVVTCGDWDFKTMFPSQLLHTYAQTGQKMTYPTIFKRWCNISKVCKEVVKCTGGMKSMLKALHIPLTGRHHCGLDDCHNTAKVVVEILNRGIDLVSNGWTDMSGFRYRCSKVRAPQLPKVCKFDGTCRIANPNHWAKVRHLNQPKPHTI